MGKKARFAIGVQGVLIAQVDTGDVAPANFPGERQPGPGLVIASLHVVQTDERRDTYAMYIAAWDLFATFFIEAGLAPPQAKIVIGHEIIAPVSVTSWQLCARSHVDQYLLARSLADGFWQIRKDQPCFHQKINTHHIDGYRNDPMNRCANGSPASAESWPANGIIANAAKAKAINSIAGGKKLTLYFFSCSLTSFFCT